MPARVNGHQFNILEHFAKFRWATFEKMMFSENWESRSIYDPSGYGIQVKIDLGSITVIHVNF